MVQLSATYVARSFSTVLNRVDAGEEIEIVRNGVLIAELRPAVRGQTISAERWRELMVNAPGVDEDFADDVARARAAIEPADGAQPS